MTSQSRRSLPIMRLNTRVMSKARHEGTQARRHEVRKSETRRGTRNRRAILTNCLRAFVPSCLLLVGCAHVPNQFVEDSPASGGNLDSDTVRDLYANQQPAPYRERGWAQTSTAAESGAVIHWPLYTEDPFEDKGTDRPDGPNKYHLGWEDYVAMPYSFSRFTLNVMAMPVSLVVQPPWKLMESDGVISKQCLGYDHDATAAEEADPAPKHDAGESAAPASAPGAATSPK